MARRIDRSRPSNNRNARRPSVDVLEGRQLLSNVPVAPAIGGSPAAQLWSRANLDQTNNDRLVIRGTTRNDVIHIRQEISNGEVFIVAQEKRGETFYELKRVVLTNSLTLDIDVSSGNDEVRNYTRVPSTVIGGPGNDTLVGGHNKDLIFGDERPIDGEEAYPASTGGDDSIAGMGDDDTLLGGAGNDYVNGDGHAFSLSAPHGNDWAEGGPGNDTVAGDLGNDTLHGDSFIRTSAGGDDTLSGGDGWDTMYGGPGNDFMDGWIGNDTMSGGSENDTMYGGPDQDTMDGDGGDDIMNGEQGNDTLFGNDGNDTMGATYWVNEEAAYANEGIYRDVHYWFYSVADDPGDDRYYGGGDDDTIRGGTGNDFLYGEDGEDTLGAMVVRTHEKTDNTTNEVGTRWVTLCEDGDDNLYGGEDNDYLRGGNGNDELYGEGGNDILGASFLMYSYKGGNQETAIKWSDYGEDGNDLMYGGEDDDTLNGGDGRDRMYGGIGNDYFTTGWVNQGYDGYNDYVYGGDGDDTYKGDLDANEDDVRWLGGQ